MKPSQGVGARLPRKEDDRFLRGRGQYVADIRLQGMKDVAFLRSPIAHARLHGVVIPDDQKHVSFSAADLAGVKAIRAVSALPGFKISEQPALAQNKIRQVGELIAMCVADTRAKAEDLVANIRVEADELPAVHDMIDARRQGSALVHEEWGDNIFLETFVDTNFDSVKDAPMYLKCGRTCTLTRYHPLWPSTSSTLMLALRSGRTARTPGAGSSMSET